MVHGTRLERSSSLYTLQGKESTLAYRFAKAVAKGQFKKKNHIVFMGLLETELDRMEREEQGKAMTNFKYPPLFFEFIANVYMVSPQTYRLLKDRFPVPSESAIRYMFVHLNLAFFH